MIKLGLGALNAIYPIGSIYVNNENVNPSAVFGGTWTLINKEFSSLMNSFSDSASDYFTANENNIELSNIAFVRNGNMLHIRLLITTKVEISETNVEVGTFNLEKLGISRFPLTRYGQVTASDSANVVVIYELNYEGILRILDVITKDGTNTISSGKTLYFDITTIFNQGYMLADGCDKFYWKRTA